MANWFLWLLVALLSSPVWGSLCWHLYDLWVRPSLISKSELKSLIDEISHYDSPLEEARSREFTAWLRGETFEQGKWHKVGRALRSREP